MALKRSTAAAAVAGARLVRSWCPHCRTASAQAGAWTGVKLGSRLVHSWCKAGSQIVAQAGLRASTTAVGDGDNATDWYFEDPHWRQRLAGIHVVYFGERHGQPALLEAQVAVIKEWAKGGNATLVLEMFTLPQQGILDQWRGMTIDKREREYEESGGDFELAHYGILVDTAIDAGMTVLAGFPTRKAARAVCSASPESPELSELVDMARLLGTGSSDQFRLFSGMIAAKDLSELDHDGELPERGRQIFPAQCWKDLMCAKTVFEKACSREGRVMVIAGCGHTDYGLGVPQRVAALAEEEAWSGLHQQLVYPLPQLAITAREVGEPLISKFRNRCVADLVVRYKPIDA